MAHNFLRLVIVGLLTSVLASACGSNQRNRRLTPVKPTGGAQGTGQKAATALDSWIQSEKAKADSEFKKAHPEQSTFGLSRSALIGYKKTIKAEINKKNQKLQEELGYIEISAQPKDNKHLSLKAEVFDVKSKTTRRLLFNLTGDIDSEKGFGQLKAEIIDDTFKQLVNKQQQQLNDPKNKTAKAPVATAKGERYSGDAKCFDKDCYNMIVRVFDNKAGSFLAYFYRAVNTGEQKAEVKAKIFEPLLVSIKNDLEKQNRLDIITRGDIEKDGYHQKMELAGSQFNLKSWYILSLVNEEYIYMMDIVEDSKNESAKIKGSAAGSIGESNFEEYTVLIKNK